MTRKSARPRTAAIEPVYPDLTHDRARVRSGWTAANGWKRVCLLWLIGKIFVSTCAPAQPAQAPASQQPALMERRKEIELALSACPPFVANNAAIYVLEKSGYVKIRDSQNGFTAIVDHALPTSQEPQCMDAEGARTFLPRMLKIAELRAEGKSREEIERFVAGAFAKGAFQPPTRPGVDYMLSTQNGVPDKNGIVTKPFPPHMMFYAPYMTNAEIGSDGKPGDGPAFIVGEGTPHALIIVRIAAHTGSDHGVSSKAPGDSR